MKMKRSSFTVAFTIGLSLLAWHASGRAAALPDSSAWRLVELFGKPVVPAAGAQSPSILLDEAGHRIEGYGGCNRFAGACELKDGGRIAFSGIAATLMACPDMETESQFFEVLGMTDNYAIAGMRLSLHKARMAPLARFEVAPAP